MIGDLHMHSYYSDGFFSPAEVLTRARDAGCEVVSLTDHDSFYGVDEADAVAARLHMQNIAGTEISAYCGWEVHILGYGFDRESKRFAAFIERQQQGRHERAAAILEKLRAHGIHVPYEELKGEVKRAPSRVHIARALVRLGYESDFREAMHKWLQKGCPTFVPTLGAQPREAIDEIHAAGGKAVLAHPMRLEIEGEARVSFIRMLADFGLDGIEAVYKGEPYEEFLALARELRLFTTAGGDFHGNWNTIYALPQNDLRYMI